MPYIGNSNNNVGEHVNNFKVLDDISSYTATFDGSATGVVSTTNETIRVADHRFLQGQRVTYNNGGGSNIGGLTSGTAYYISLDTANTVKLATSLVNANNNTVINLSSVGSGSSHTLTAAFDGVNKEFKLTYGTKAAIVLTAPQLNIAINNVIQRPNLNPLSFTEGFAVKDGNKIIFQSAPEVNDVFWGSITSNSISVFDVEDNTVDNFTGDGSTTNFTLSSIPPNKESILVTLDGVVQHPSDNSTTRSYTIDASVVAFTSAPASGVAIQVRHIGFASPTTPVRSFYGRTGNVTLNNTDDIVTRNINSSGIITASSFSGSFSGAISATSATFSGDVSIGGTLTYEDVKNVDSVGFITARSGILVQDDATFTGAVGNMVFDKSDSALEFGDGLKASFGNSSDLQLYHSGSNAFFTNSTGFFRIAATTTGGGLYLDGSSVFIRSEAGDENLARFINDGAVELYHNNVKRLETSSVGVSIPQDLDVDGHTNLDNVSIAGITTMGQTTIFTTGGTTLLLKDSDSSNPADRSGIAFVDQNNTQTAFIGKESASDAVLTINNTNTINPIRLKVNNTTRLEVGNAGVYATGSLSATGTLSAGGILYIPDEIQHSGDADTKIRFPADNNFTVETAGSERLRIDPNGRVSLNDNSRPAGDTNEGAQLRVTGAPITRNQYYSPAGHYYGSFGYTDNTYTKSWIAVDSSYAKSSAVSAGIFLSAFHQDAGGSACGFTIKNLKNGNPLVISSVVTAASVGNPAVETERLRINTNGTIGINTTAEIRQLEIFNSSHATAALKSDTQSSLFFSDSADTNIGQISYMHSGSPNNYMYFRVNDQERVRITSTGNVNIGTSELDQTVSGRLLNVYGGQIRARQTSSGNTLEAFGHTTSGQSYGLLVNAGTTANDYAATFRNSGGTTMFRVRGDGSVRVGDNSSFSGHSAASNLVVGTTSGSNGMTILTGSATGNIFFNDGSGNDGVVQYVHSSSPNYMRIASSGHVRFDVAAISISDDNIAPSAGDMSSGASFGTPRLHMRGDNSQNGAYELMARFQSGTDSNDSGATIVLNHSNDRGLALQGGRGQSNRSFGAIKSIDNLGRLSSCIDFLGGNGQGVNRLSFYTGESTTTSEALRINSSQQVRIGDSFGSTFQCDLDVIRNNSTLTDVMLVKGNTGNGFIRFQDNDNSCNFTFGADDGSGLGTGAFILYDRNNSAYRWSVDSSGNMRVWDGNVRLASGHGIDFSSTGNGSGSSSSELFDDYEEGSWTPTAHSGGSGVTVYAARYTKVGNKVTIDFRGNLTGTNGNVAQIGGLPYANLASNAHNVGPVMHNGFDYGGSTEPVATSYITGTNSYFQLYYSQTNSNGWHHVTGNETGGDQFITTLTYFTS